MPATKRRRTLPEQMDGNLELICDLGGPHALAEFATSHGLWLAVWVARPHLRSDWTPAWRSHTVPVHMSVREESGTLYPASSMVSFECWPQHAHHQRMYGSEALIMVGEYGPVVGVLPFSMRMSTYRGKFSLDWRVPGGGTRPMIVMTDWRGWERWRRP